MKLLFLHLTDIHWKTDGLIDPNRFAKIGVSIASVSIERPEAVFIVYSGDLAWSGKFEEYAALEPHLALVESSVVEVYGAGVKIHRIVVPGNHDCNFGIDQSAR